MHHTSPTDTLSVHGVWWSLTSFLLAQEEVETLLDQFVVQ